MVNTISNAKYVANNYVNLQVKENQKILDKIEMKSSSKFYSKILE